MEGDTSEEDFFYNAGEINDVLEIPVKQKNYKTIEKILFCEEQFIYCFKKDNIFSLEQSGDPIIYGMMKKRIYDELSEKNEEYPLAHDNYANQYWCKIIDCLMIRYTPICVLLVNKRNCALKRLPDDLIRYTSELLH